jgi:hypothetical protein
MNPEQLEVYIEKMRQELENAHLATEQKLKITKELNSLLEQINNDLDA